jgi:hypothetical protein
MGLKKRYINNIIGMKLIFISVQLLHCIPAIGQNSPSNALIIKGGYNLPIIRDHRWNHNLIGSELTIAFDKYLDPSFTFSSAVSYGQNSFHGEYFLRKFKYSEPLLHAERGNSQMAQFRLGFKIISDALDKTYFNLGLGAYFIHMPPIDIYFQNGTERIDGFNRVSPLGFIGVGKEVKILEKVSLMVEGNLRYLHNVRPGANIRSIQEFNILTGIKIFL